MFFIKIKRFELIFWVVTGLIVLTGFGSFFSILYKPFYSLLPFFSKFRIPSMIYLLLAITIPILGARGLDIFIKVYEEKKEMKQPQLFETEDQYGEDLFTGPKLIKRKLDLKIKIELIWNMKKKQKLKIYLFLNLLFS